MPEAVHVEAVGDVSVVVVDVPAAASPDALKDLARALYRADRACGDPDEPKAAGIVLRATDGAFCSGFVDAVYALDRAAFAAFVDDLEAVCLQLFSLRVPVIAALTGDVTGPGAIFALAADERVAPMQAPFSFQLADVRDGLPFGSAALEIAKHTIPSHQWTDLLMRSARLSRADALDRAVVDELAVDVVSAAKDRAASYASQGARAVQKTKLDLRHDALARARARAIESRRIVVEHFFDPVIIARR